MSGHGRPCIDLTGKRFGRWTVLSRGPNAISADETSTKARWYCRCDCGTVRLVYGASLRCGLSTSCGCYRSEVTSAGTMAFNLSRDYSKRRPKGYAKRIG